MIGSIRNKGLRQFAESGDGSKLSVQKPDRLRRILNLLDQATRPEDLNIPGLRFHALAGDRQGRYALTVSGNWRVTFGWPDDQPVEVDLEDYH